MLRNIGAVLLSVFIGSMFVGLMVRLNLSLYPMPENLTLENEAGLKEHIESLPSKAFYLVIAGHVLGATIAAFISSKLAESHKFLMGIAGMIIMSVATMSMFLTFPHPIWVIIVDLLGVMIFGFIAARLGAGQLPNYEF